VLDAEELEGAGGVVEAVVDEGDEVLLVEVDDFDGEVGAGVGGERRREVEAGQAEAEAFLGEFEGFQLDVRAGRACFEVFEGLGADL